MSLHIELASLNKPSLVKDSGLIQYQGSMDIKILTEKGNLTIDLLLPNFKIDF
jgi:hypothetical protein